MLNYQFNLSLVNVICVFAVIGITESLYIFVFYHSETILKSFVVELLELIVIVFLSVPLKVTFSLSFFL